MFKKGNGILMEKIDQFFQLEIISDDGDEILLLSRYRVDVTEGSRGKYLRLTDSSNIYNLQFEAIGEMNLWLTRLLQVFFFFNTLWR